MKSVDLSIARFEDYLATQGARLTVQRRAVAEVFFRGEKHLSLMDLLERAKVEQPSIGYATVYRTMRLLTEGGLATEHKFGENQTRYEPLIEGEHHDHFICLDCGKILEFEDSTIERRQDRIAEDLGFKVVSHKHEVYVRCVREPCDDRGTGVGAAPGAAMVE